MSAIQLILVKLLFKYSTPLFRSEREMKIPGLIGLEHLIVRWDPIRIFFSQN